MQLRRKSWILALVVLLSLAGVAFVIPQLIVQIQNAGTVVSTWTGWGVLNCVLLSLLGSGFNPRKTGTILLPCGVRTLVHYGQPQPLISGWTIIPCGGDSRGGGGWRYEQ